MGKNILTRELLLKSVEEWNAAREAYPDLKPDLIRVDLRSANLQRANFRDAILIGADLRDVNLSWAVFEGANLCEADFSRAVASNSNFNHSGILGANFTQANLHLAKFIDANLRDANFSGATLIDADFTVADLSRANLSGAEIGGVNFCATALIETNFDIARLGDTTFGDIDLSGSRGLETVRHRRPSTIGIDTIYKSNGNIPEVFLRGCGVPDNFIEYIHSLTAKPFDYYSCFISHSTADKVFADRLHADLQAKGVRCWYAPHDMEGGEHIDTQIDRAIKVHEKVLLVLSESSINSNWVKREITKAVKREEAEGKRVLFPINLVDFSKIEEWEFVDSKGRDLSEEIRKFYIPSFKGWENDNSLYTTEFDKLLKAFKDKSKQ